MSDAAGIALVSHVYGSTPRGFATVFADPSIGPDVLRDVERRCSYSLPFALSRAEPASAPVKYLFGVSGTSGFVGRARYLGVDLTGRLGNYVCHTLVFDLDDASRLFEGPLDVIEGCESAGLFLSDALAEGAVVAPARLECAGVALREAAALPAELLLDLVSAALRGPGTDPAILLRGDAPTVLPVLNEVFSHLPYSKRWSCTFDTYGLGGFPQGLVFTALPPDRAYTPVPPHSALVDPGAGTISWVRGDPGRHALARLVCTTATDPEDRAALLSAIDLIEARQWVELTDTLTVASSATRAALLAEYRAALLGRMAEADDRALAEGFDESLAPDDLFAVAHAMRPALIGASGARARGAFARGVVSRAAEPGIAGLAFCDEQFLGACIDLARAMRQSPAFTVALVRALPGAYEPWREAHVVSAVLEELRTALPPATISALGQALLALPAAPTPEMDRKRSLALYATGHTPALGRFVTRASAEAGYWDAHPDMLRYVAENLLQVSYEDAAGMLVTLVGHIPRGPSLGMLDRVLAGRLEMPGGIGEDRRERKAFGKVLSKQGITADALPETFRVLTGERDGGSADPDTRGRGRDR